MVEIARLRRTLRHIQPDGSPIPLFPRPDIQIAVVHDKNLEGCRLHCHDFVEIVIVESGVGVHLYEDVECHIQAGDVFVIRPEHAHTFVSPAGLSIYNVLFYDDGSIPLLGDLAQLPSYRAMFHLEPMLRRSVDAGGRIRLDFKNLKDVLSLVIELEEVLRSPEPANAAFAKVLFLHLVAALCRLYDASPPRTGASFLQVSRAISYIEKRYHEPICVADLASHVNMSLRNFQRHFRMATGITPVRYIARQRIAEACRLLRENANVTEVALTVGFSDPSYFSRAFREELGTTPKRYQLNLR